MLKKMYESYDPNYNYKRFNYRSNIDIDLFRSLPLSMARVSLAVTALPVWVIISSSIFPLDFPAPVSYTHLDVYKRQMEGYLFCGSVFPSIVGGYLMDGPVPDDPQFF